jgi:hypothetical protein
MNDDIARTSQRKRNARDNGSGASLMSADYVEQRNGGYYLKGTRVSLDQSCTRLTTASPPRPYARIFLP